MNQLQHKQYTGKGGIAVGTALCLGHKNAFALFHHCSGVDGGTHDLAYRHRFSGEGGLVHHGFALQYHAVQRYRQHGDTEAQALPHGKPLHDPEQNALRFVCRGKEAGTAEKQKQRFLSGTTSPQAVPAAGEPTISMTALLELLKNADPEVKAQLRLALLT